MNLGNCLHVLHKLSSPSSLYISQSLFLFKNGQSSPSNIKPGSPSSYNVILDLNISPNFPVAFLYFSCVSSSIIISHPAQHVSGHSEAIHLKSL